jgi:hypothetical protein
LSRVDKSIEITIEIRAKTDMERPGIASCGWVGILAGSRIARPWNRCGCWRMPAIVSGNPGGRIWTRCRAAKPRPATRTERDSCQDCIPAGRPASGWNCIRMKPVPGRSIRVSWLDGKWPAGAGCPRHTDGNIRTNSPLPTSKDRRPCYIRAAIEADSIPGNGSRPLALDLQLPDSKLHGTGPLCHTFLSTKIVSNTKEEKRKGTKHKSGGRKTKKKEKKKMELELFGLFSFPRHSSPR